MGYLLAALLSGLLIFNGVATPEKAAHMAEKALQKQYPTSKVNVEIEGKRGKNVLKGNFKKVHVGLADITLADLPFNNVTSDKPGAKPKIARAGKLEVELKNLTWGTLPVEYARFDFENVEYDFRALQKTSQFIILGMTSGQMKLRFATQQLKPAFTERLKDIENVGIDLQGDDFTLTGQRDVLGSKSPVELKAKLVGVGNGLRLEQPKLSLSGTQLPEQAALNSLKDVNPIYQFDQDGKWPFSVNITSVVGAGEHFDLTADLKLKPPSNFVPLPATTG